MSELDQSSVQSAAVGNLLGGFKAQGAGENQAGRQAILDKSKSRMDLEAGNLDMAKRGFERQRSFVMGAHRAQMALQKNQMAAREAQLNFQREMMRRQQEQQKKQARSGLLGSVLGIGGAIVGGIASAGNPLGVIAGAQLGQGLGSFAGQQGA